MLMDKTGQQPGRRQFLEQRARLQASLNASRVNDTATRFNRLDDACKKVIFILANDASRYIAGMPKLTAKQLGCTYENLTEKEQTSLLMGIKRLSEFAASMPWEFEDYAAPRAEIQAIRDKPPAPDNAAN
ncbi:hypothetical protein CSM97_000599 [Salmonella enterica subsp. diarizonae]|nr:hypothetical protein [Salmonella enterica subsp. diarizonae]ECI5275519.1 hypothetical protein [Salmonella enterica subsp. diarizonae]EDK8462835.1 hypothetical protein [Salmonella enterica subsp. diarizonae]EDX6218154.1 hypothetical protein [Salmonella enterica subsp. diarizonae]MDJ7597217.1 hypothetical protein [Salmonella enterica]